MVGSVVVYAGLVAILVGVVALVARWRYRWQLLGLGLITSSLGLLLPARETKVPAVQTRLDEFAPRYQFSESHAIRVNAPCGPVYDAIRGVTASEITLFGTLTWIRRFGRPGPESILNAPERLPLLDVAIRSGFLELALDPAREIVVGAIVAAPPGAPGNRLTPADFKALSDPGFARAAMNFRLEPAGPNGCAVTTETRVYATDGAARRRFAAYWRVIYPGSALIRRMWLRAVKQRAEHPTLRTR